MAKTEVYRDADHLSLPVPSGVKSGDPVAVGALVGVAETDRDADGFATVALKGAYDMSTTDPVASVGLALYIVTATRAITTAATGNTLFGYSLATKGSGAGTVPVRIAQV